MTVFGIIKVFFLMINRSHTFFRLKYLITRLNVSIFHSDLGFVKFLFLSRKKKKI